MRLRLDRLSSAVRARRWRSRLMMAIAIALILFGAVFGGLVVLTFVEAALHPERPGVDVGAASFCAFFGVLVPFVAAGVVLLARARTERTLKELQLLVSEAGPDARVDRASLEARGWTRERADAVLMEAITDGVLADDAYPVPGSAPASPMTPIPSSPPMLSPVSPILLPTPAPAPSSYPAPAMLPSVQPQAQPTPPPHQRAPAVANTRPGRVGSNRPAPTSALAGRVLKGTYLVEEELGRGGMGAVHAARHLRTGRRYAVKTLLPTERVSQEAILRFEREARAAGTIGHAGIVAVHDFDATEDGVHFIVMDLLEGATLETRLARVGRLEWPEARRVALEIADAVGAAHRAGILHRDLKPANVFLAELPGYGTRTILVDFGLAKPIEEGSAPRVTSTGAVVGTALYMSPEQARGAPLDVRSDVYGVAAVLYEMVTGVPPFLGPTALAVMTMVLSEQTVPPSVLAPGLPREVDALLAKGLAKDPKQRFPTTVELATAIAAIG